MNKTKYNKVVYCIFCFFLILVFVCEYYIGALMLKFDIEVAIGPFRDNVGRLQNRINTFSVIKLVSYGVLLIMAFIFALNNQLIGRRNEENKLEKNK